MRINRAIMAACLLAAPAWAFDATPLLQWVTAPTGDTYFTITFVTGTPPTTLSLGVGAAYAGPATPSQALYDAGNGVWTAYTSNTITMRGSYIKFRGDWRNASGSYLNMFYNSLTSTDYTCEFSGTLDFAATAANAYNTIFRGNTRVTAIRTNPFQKITGSPSASMFNGSFYGMSGVTGQLPPGFLDTSALTGPPAANMFVGVCFNMGNVTGSLPSGFISAINMNGPPSANMYLIACQGMANITSGDFQISTNVSLTDGNIIGPLTSAWRDMPRWGGQVFWGTNVIHTVLTPTSDINAFAGSTNVPGFSTMNANWK
jgi:hypothetical protein